MFVSYRNFDCVVDDIGFWLLKFKMISVVGCVVVVVKGGRMGLIEVEVVSIMSVLKDFDVRFGREV